MTKRIPNSRKTADEMRDTRSDYERTADDAQARGEELTAYQNRLREKEGRPSLFSNFAGKDFK